MKMKGMLPVLGVLGGLGGIALAAGLAHGADLQPMVVTNLSGQLRIEQALPCGDDLDLTTPVTAGRIEISPTGGVDVRGGRGFAITRMSVFFGAFSTHVSCLGRTDDETYSEVGAQLGKPVIFTGSPVRAGVYDFTIPKDTFLVRQAAIRNGISDTSITHPAEDVTGTIDFNLGTVHLHVKMATSLHLPTGEDKAGSQTADIDGSTR